MKPTQLFPERRDVPLSRQAEQVLYVFSSGSGGDAFYSLKCLERVPFPLWPVSFHLSSSDIFAWRPGGERRDLWSCESSPQ